MAVLTQALRYRPLGHPHSRKAALVAVLLALLAHGLLIYYSGSISLLSPSAPAPVRVREVDPAELARVRRQWKERALLLQQKDQAAPEKDAPADARYFSDRNRTVREERRARESAPVPREGAQPQAVPNLAQLGVRMPMPATRRQAPAQSAQDQALSDRALQEGDANLLNTVESVYYSYYSRLYQAVAPVWNSRIREAAATAQGLPQGEYVSRAEVVFDREGNLREVVLVQSSGVPAFDQAIEHAWRRIQRFPNPPRDLLNASGEVRTGWTFTVSLDPSSGFQFWQPQRAY